ncbi:MAG: RNA polymerase sigma factor [Geminicoccaceae bacterium]
MSDPADQSGCQKAFVQLAEQHLDSLYRTALRMTNDRSVAEDIVQEACLKAYANFGRYSPDTNFKAWLFRILANLCIDHLRRNATISMVPIDTAPLENEGVASSDRRTDSPEVQAMRRDTQQALIDALSTLDPEPRAVVVLILIEGMSYDEAAESLDLPLNTIRSKLHRARKRLQERLSLVYDEESQNARHTTNTLRVISLF